MLDDPPSPGNRGDDSGGSAEAKLAWRLRQQQLLAEFGLFALRCDNRNDLLNEVTRIAAEGMNVDLCKFLEPDSDETGMLIVRAGIGWNEGVVGVAKLGADKSSPAGYAFESREPVISNHFDAEERFRIPALFAEHGIKRALNVPVRNDDACNGVLEVDSRDPGRFNQEDIAFMEGLAAFLAVSLERHRTARDLSHALERETLLTHEMRHRVKNLFSVVNGLISMSEREARRSNQPDTTVNRLRARITALARSTEIGLCEMPKTADLTGVNPVALSRSVLAPFSGRFEVSGSAQAILPQTLTTPVALMLYEFATNAVKHGALSSDEGTIDLCWFVDGTEIGVQWIESGGPAIDTEPPQIGFGASMVSSIIASAGGTLEMDWVRTGLRATVRFAR